MGMNDVVQDHAKWYMRQVKFLQFVDLTEADAMDILDQFYQDVFAHGWKHCMEDIEESTFAVDLTRTSLKELLRVLKEQDTSNILYIKFLPLQKKLLLSKYEDFRVSYVINIMENSV